LQRYRQLSVNVVKAFGYHTRQLEDETKAAVWRLHSACASAALCVFAVPLQSFGWGHQCASRDLFGQNKARLPSRA
jgi:hypothetical protein